MKTKTSPDTTNVTFVVHGINSREKKSSLIGEWILLVGFISVLQNTKTFIPHVFRRKLSS